MEYKEINRVCILCGNKDVELVWDKADRAEKGILNAKFIIRDRDTGKMYNSKVVICGKCGLMYTNPMLTSSTLEEFYKTEYRKIFAIDNYNVCAGQHALSALNTLREMEGIARFKSVLDVGCGPGAILVNKLKNLGYCAQGLDTDIDIPGVIHDYEVLGQCKYDVITIMNTLEHVYNPVQMLKQLRKHVKKFILIGVPNAAGEFNCTVDGWFSAAHLWHFDKLTLSNLLRLSGYGVHSVFDKKEAMGDKIHIVAVPSDDKKLVIRKPRVDIIKRMYKSLDIYQRILYSNRYEKE